MTAVKQWAGQLPVLQPLSPEAADEGGEMEPFESQESNQDKGADAAAQGVRDSESHAHEHAHKHSVTHTARARECKKERGSPCTFSLHPPHHPHSPLSISRVPLQRGANVVKKKKFVER